MGARTVPTADAVNTVLRWMNQLADQYEGQAMLEPNGDCRASLHNQSVAYRVVISDMTAQLASADTRWSD